jgi:hypothetical protein
VTPERAAELRQMRCIGEAVSWLRLEQHRLGELTAADAAAVEAHLATCPACAACAAETSEPFTFSLPNVVTREAFASGPRARTTSSLRSWRAEVSAGVVSAAAVAVAFVFLKQPAPVPGSRPSSVTFSSRHTLSGSKGGDIAIELVRERRGDVVHGAHTFLAEDRWKVLVTCSAERVPFWDVVVEDGGQASFPLSPSSPIACGNHVALPGAFQLSAVSTKRLCVLFSGDPVDRRRFASGGSIDLDRDLAAEQAVCVTLRPEGAAADADLGPGVVKDD